MLTLTGKEIKDLAEAVGLMIQPLDYANELETEMTITECPPSGVMDDDGKATHYEHVAYLSEHPEEGAFPLGDEMSKENGMIGCIGHDGDCCKTREQDLKDAERYRWLRAQHWSESAVAVVSGPKQNVRLGAVCPSDTLLDETIDALMRAGAGDTAKETSMTSRTLYPQSPDPTLPAAVAAFESLHGEGSWSRTVLSIRVCWTDAWTLATRLEIVEPSE